MGCTVLSVMMRRSLVVVQSDRVLQWPEYSGPLISMRPLLCM